MSQKSVWGFGTLFGWVCGEKTRNKTAPYFRSKGPVAFWTHESGTAINLECYVYGLQREVKISALVMRTCRLSDAIFPSPLVRAARLLRHLKQKSWDPTNPPKTPTTIGSLKGVDWIPKRKEAGHAFFFHSFILEQKHCERIPLNTVAPNC